MTDENLLRSLILKSEKPGRYTGGEYNTPDMDKPASTRVCICFPDVYEVAMSNLGIRILYHLLNDTPDVAAERCFAPWPDFGARLKDNDVPLFSLETRRPLTSFDIVGFSFQYELSYTNCLYMLDLAGIPFYAAERGEEYPLLIAGGPCMYNPEPIADFFDIIQIGDGEETLPPLVQLYQACKKSGASKREYLEQAAQLPGLHVPSVQQKCVRRAVLKDLETAYFPTKVQVPNIEVIHDRGVLELFRGCTRGCRFCQAGMIYRPVRERKCDTLLAQAEELISCSGFDELSLSSLSTGDYSALSELVKGLIPLTEKKGVRFTLPSLRLDSFLSEYAAAGRKGGSLTFAPEAGTQRLRDVINKNVTEKDFTETLAGAFQTGCDAVKLYFMMGLPTETQEDLAGIAEMAKLARKVYAEKTGRNRLRVSVSCAVFIPKAFTPFQWEAQDDADTVREKQAYLAGLFKNSRVSFHYHDYKTSAVEAVLARGDRKLSAALVAAYRGGARFDGWTEYFSYETWMEAFAAGGVSVREYAGARPLDAPLPWDFIDAGVTRKYLEREREKALAGVTTQDCRRGCTGCGMRGLGVC